MINSKVFLITGVILSFIIASMLNIYPLGYIGAVIRPMYLMMVLVFWVMYRSVMMSVWSVFLVGLVADLLLGTYLGQQAFSALLMAFVVRIILLSVKELKLAQAWFIAAIGLSVFQVSLWILQSFSHHQLIWLGFGSLLSSIILFPLLWYPLFWLNDKHKERAY